MSCNFALPDVSVRVPGFSLPPMLSLKGFGIDLDIDPPELPSLPFRVPGFSLPLMLSLKLFSVDLDIDPPELPGLSLRVPGFALPPVVFPFSVSVACPFD